MSIKNNHLNFGKVFAVAPMMDWTDRHCRYFHRLMTSNALLYTEMITSAALIRGNAVHLLDYNIAEQPLALQLGGSDPRELSEAARLGEDRGYTEVNLNIGCPSSRVKAGSFGAVLMEQPKLVAECIAEMRKAVSIDITVKCRIGVDNQSPEDTLPYFLSEIQEAGVDKVTIHARKALLDGLSPKQNRNIPPLDYEIVSKMKKKFDDLHISINGGISTLASAISLINTDFDGVMVGRAAYNSPWEILSNVDQTIYNAVPKLITRFDIIMRMMPYIKNHLMNGGKVHQVTRHMIGLFNGEKNARKWRQTLSQEGVLPYADETILLKAYENMMAATEVETIADVA